MNLSVRKKLKRGGIFVLLAAIFCACAIPFFLGAGSSGKVRLIVDLHGYTPSTSRTPTPKTR